MARKKKSGNNPDTHKDLKGFDIKINEFGELTSSLSIEKLNKFLNQNVEDKKLRVQDDDDNKAQENQDEE